MNVSLLPAFAESYLQESRDPSSLLSRIKIVGNDHASTSAMAEELTTRPPPTRRPSSGNAGHTTTLVSPPPLRNRLLKSKTSFDGALPAPAPPRRRSSLLSDFSLDDAHHSVRSSTGSFLLPKISGNHKHHDLHQEPSHWHSAPLAFAIVPAVAGLFFKNGTAFATDMLLLALAAIFLNWSVRLPWSDTIIALQNS